MRIKYIIGAVIGAVGIMLGAWNWVNYFKQQNAGNVPQIQAVRPKPRPEIAALEKKQAAQQAATEKQPGNKTVELVKVQFPDTIGRNPFLSPDEIWMIAHGELVEEEPPPVDTGPLPELRISALLRDKEGGGYVALINGKSYREGQKIGQEEVVRITEEQVLLELPGGQQRVLNFGKKQSSGVFNIEMRKN